MACESRRCEDWPPVDPEEQSLFCDREIVQRKGVAGGSRDDSKQAQERGKAIPEHEQEIYLPATPQPCQFRGASSGLARRSPSQGFILCAMAVG